MSDPHPPPPASLLADGSAPRTPDQLLERLRGLGIAARTLEHPAVFTVEEARRYRGDLPGTHTKSLFLRDKKGAMWLVVSLEDRAVDLKDLARRLGAKHLSFGSPDRLMRYLGMIPGAVNPFAAINDTGRRVRVVLDRGVLAGERVNLHRLDNARTTAIATADLLRFLEAEGHPPEPVDFATRQTAMTRAILIARHGAPEVLAEREVPLRDPAPDEVHLRVHAAGVNFADLVMRMGLYGTVPPRPYSPGFEVAGEVARAGANVRDWRAGDRAVALLRFGGYARDVVVPARNLFRYPETLSAAEAAAVPVVFLTAWVALFESARARAGETVLVLGAAGGVGTAAVQFAVRRGLKVIGTAGTAAKRTFVIEQLGATVCLDSRGDWETEVRGLLGERGLDVALDPVGGRATRACRRLLAPLGRLVCYGLSDAIPGTRRRWLRAAWAWLRTPPFDPYSLMVRNIGVLGIHLLHLGPRDQVLRPALAEIFGGITAGQWRPILDRTFPLDRDGAVAAHRYLHLRQNLGKVVLVV